MYQSNIKLLDEKNEKLLLWCAQVTRWCGGWTSSFENFIFWSEKCTKATEKNSWLWCHNCVLWINTHTHTHTHLVQWSVFHQLEGGGVNLAAVEVHLLVKLLLLPLLNLHSQTEIQYVSVCVCVCVCVLVFPTLWIPNIPTRIVP